MRRLININEIKVRRVSCWICTGISERGRYSLALTFGECATRGGKKERETERNLLEIEKETEMLLLDFQAAIALAYEINKIIYILYMQF